MAPRSRSHESRAAIGLRSHSGWAVVVAAAGSVGGPVLVVRRRVELSRETPRQPFHAALGLPFPAAEALVRRSAEEVGRLAEDTVREAAREIRSMGYELVAGGLLVAAGRALPDLRGVLASHALVHAAEGELFRDALRQASLRCGLLVANVKEKELEALAAKTIGRSEAEIRRQLAAWGKALGPPWTQDEKRAALVAWLALAGNGTAA
jgi:hypothetical protein